MTTLFGRVAKATGLSSLWDRAANLRCRLAASRFNPIAQGREIERLKTKCDKQAMMLQRIFPDRNPGVFFICGEGGEKDRNYLPERIYVCPAYGCGWSQVYERSDRTVGGM